VSGATFAPLLRHLWGQLLPVLKIVKSSKSLLLHFFLVERVIYETTPKDNEKFSAIRFDEYAAVANLVRSFLRSKIQSQKEVF